MKSYKVNDMSKVYSLLPPPAAALMHLNNNILECATVSSKACREHLEAVGDKDL